MYGGAPPVATVAALFEKMCYENKDQLTAGIIVAGWDEEKGGSVYNIPLGGGMFQQPWAIGGELFCPRGVRLADVQARVRRTCTATATRRTRRAGERRRRSTL